MLALFLNILIPILLAGIVNFIIYQQKWNINNSTERNKLLPPGYVIAIVWVIILGLLGAVNFLVSPSIATVFVIATIIYCISYPFLTAGLKKTNMYIFNVVALLLSYIAALTVLYVRPFACILMVPLLLWTSYVNIADALDKSNKNLSQ